MTSLRVHGAHAINNIVDDTNPTTKERPRTANFVREAEVEVTMGTGTPSEDMTGRRLGESAPSVTGISDDSDGDGAMDQVGVSEMGLPLGDGKRVGVLSLSFIFGVSVGLKDATSGVVVGAVALGIAVVVTGMTLAIPGDSVGTIPSLTKSGQVTVLAVSYDIMVQAMGCLLPSAI